jgi:hypothetical protein
VIENALLRKPTEKDDLYGNIVQDMHSYAECAGEEISEAEAHDAARRLIAFTKLLLESDRDQRQTPAHAESQPAA